MLELLVRFYLNWLIMFFRFSLSTRPWKTKWNSTRRRRRRRRRRSILSISRPMTFQWYNSMEQKRKISKLNFNLKRYFVYFQFILLLLVTGGYSAPKPQDSYGAPAAPSTYGAPAADSYGSPQAPAVDSYGAPQAPVCRTEQSPAPLPGAECNPNPPQCVDQV